MKAFARDLRVIFVMRTLAAVPALLALGVSTPLSAQGLQAEAQGAAADDIIVTAQRRSERLQDVPVAITAFDGNTLERLNIQGTRDLGVVTPGLNFTQSVYSPQPTIRGIGLRGVGAGDESVVPIYIDGAYQPSIAGANLQFNNIERIEVLKGPQGALLGRNATAGAINIITRTPTDGATARISLSYGRFNQLVAKAYAAIGNEQIGADVALLSNRDDGYVHDVVSGTTYGDTQDLSIRSKLRFTPNEAVEIIIAGAHTNSKSSSGEAYRVLDRNSIGARIPGNILGTQPFEAALSQTPFNNLKLSSLSGTLKFDLGPVALTSITSYQKSKLQIFADSDGSSAVIASIAYDQTSRNIYHETYATSQWDGPLNIVAGAVYYHSRDATPFFSNQSRTVSLAGVVGALSNLGLTSVGHTDSYAGYAQGTLRLNSQFSVIAAGRYTSEKRDVSVKLFTAAAPFTNQATFKKFTPSVTVQFTPNRNINIFAKYGEAFKSGIFNLTATTLAAVAPVRPENVRQAELGLKMRLAPGVQFNISGYYTDYKNLQSPARNAIGQSFLQNAGAAKIYGGEADISWKLSPQLTLFAGLSLLHGKYQNFPNSQGNLPNSIGDTAAPTACAVNAGALTGGNRTVICNVSGNSIIRTPFVQANGGFDYRIPVGEGEVGLSGKAYYSGHSYWDTLNYYREPSYVLLSGDISWKPGTEELRVSLWGDNLLNEKYSVTKVISGTATNQVLARPRSYGVRMNAAF